MTTMFGRVREVSASSDRDSSVSGPLQPISAVEATALIHRWNVRFIGRFPSAEHRNRGAKVSRLAARNL
jgi:hypothetical protein